MNSGYNLTNGLFKLFDLFHFEYEISSENVAAVINRAALANARRREINFLDVDSYTRIQR